MLAPGRTRLERFSHALGNLVPDATSASVVLLVVVVCAALAAAAVGVHEAKLYGEKLAAFQFWAHLLGGIGRGAFRGMAGLQGMLRRSLCVNGEFNAYMILAALSGSLLLLAFLAFFYNIVMSLGLKGVIGIFTPSKLDTTDPMPAA